MFIIVISSCYVEDFINILCPSLSLVIFLDLRAILSHSEKAMAPHSSTVAWKIPWAEEPGRLQSMGSLRVGHD